MTSEGEETLTLRQYLIRTLLLESVLRGMPADPFTAVEAVHSTAIEHPEWDLDQRMTWEEWEAWEGLR